MVDESGERKYLVQMIEHLKSMGRVSMLLCTKHLHHYWHNKLVIPKYSSMAIEASVNSLQHSSCILRFRRNPIANRKAFLGFGFGFRHNEIRCENIRSSSESQGRRRGEAVVVAARKRNQSPVRCAAEGTLFGGEETEAMTEEVGTMMMPERRKVVILTACMMCLCNADRVVMSVAVVPLAEKLGWSSSFLGVVQSSFLWGYIFSSVIGGALVDRYGGKQVLAWGVALWSLATLLTPWAAAHSTLALLWFPTDERASAVGISMAGFHMGNVVGLLLTPLMLSTSIGISGPFILFASLGLLWVSTWSSGVTNNPQDSPFITRSELRLIQAGKPVHPPANIMAKSKPSLRLLLSKLPTWAIIFANVTNNWVFNVNLKQAAWFSALPWATMAVSGYFAGSASDFLIRTGHSVTSVRKIMQSIGFMGPGLSLLCLNYAKTPSCAAIFMTIALSLSSFSQAGFLLNMQDIAPQYAGFLHGISNCAGTLAAIVSTIGTGYFVQWLGSFQAFLTVTTFLYFAATVFWILFATGERVF
ncbi:hypothetical protein EUTSA_v10017818mg [Eutrema salsugineum]|uniref:Major facilitator superfamily (MFS) profile domain-containing protein n=1 Tax=Eutrema salsugineum TaxID=72664 RepID=V4LPF9_EUTSA|nr:hypothetical protein EUTSA_v10017818mg [Eutrema salsugineum]